MINLLKNTNQRNTQEKLFTYRKLSFFLIPIVISVLFTSQVSATLFAPGTTLDPDCPPTAPLSGCGIIPSGSGDMSLSAVQTITGAKTFNDGKLLIAGLTSGAATLNAPAVAGTLAYTLPSSGGVLALVSQITGTNSGTNTGDVTLVGQNYLSISNQIITANAINLGGANVTGTLLVANGGTGASTVSGAKVNLGLDLVNNTADTSKPISTAQQTALDLKANLASPTFTGTVTIPTPFTLGVTSVTTTGTELNLVVGVTSNIQTQINSKQGTLVNSLGLLTALGGDKTGTGLAVFGTSPNIITPTGIVKNDVGLGNVDNTSNITERAATASLTNKSFQDSTTSIFNSLDISKILKFNIGGTTAITGTIATNFTTAKTLTLPDATDTLVGKATTDTFTNKTFDTAGTGNLFFINGLATASNTGTGSVVRATSPTITTPIIADFTNANHAHTSVASGGQLNATSVFSTGIIPTARLAGTGTADSTTFLRGDQTWGVPSGAGDMVLAGVQTVTGAKTFGTIGGAVGKFILAGSSSGSTILNAAAVAGTTTITLPGITGTVLLTDGSAASLTGLPIVAGTTGTLTEIRGGTNQTTYATGDILYASATNTLSKLPAGTNGHVLTLAAGIPSWAASGGGGGGGGWTEDTGFNKIYTTTVGRNVGIGTVTPGSKLTIEGTAPILELRSAGHAMFRPTANDWDMRIFGGGTQPNMYLGFASGSAPTTALMAIKQDGNVGIGVNPPLSKLHVSGGQARLPNGSVVAGNSPGIAFDSFSDTGIAADANNFAIWESGVLALDISNLLKEYRVPSDYKYSFSSATNNNASSDTSFYRNSAGVIRTGGGFIIDGVLTSGLINSQTISSAASFTGTLATAGAINSTVTGIQTGGVTRIDTSGNLTNIANITSTGKISVSGAQILGASPLVFEGLNDNDFTTTLALPDPGASITLTIPNIASDTFAFLAATQTLTNKSISFATNTVTGTTAQFNIALTDNDFATLAGTEILTNKTISGGTFSGTIAGAHTYSGLATLNANAVIGNGAVTAGVLSINEDTDLGAQKVNITVPSLAADYTLTLPVDDGTSGQVLSTDGAGVLSWAAGGGGGGWIDNGATVSLINPADQVTIPIGSQFAPALAFENDLDTGIFSDNTNTINIATGGLERLRINNIGHVGIGINPSQQLQITGNFRLPASTATVGIIYSGLDTFIHSFGNNFFAGVGAGNLTMTSTGNTAVGSIALRNNSTGDSNVAIGTSTLTNNTTGSRNTGVGTQVLGNNQGGDDNIGIGNLALNNNTGGSRNTVVGSSAFFELNVASGATNNTAIGYNTGRNIVTGINNTILGANVSGLPAGLSNSVIIGSNISSLSTLPNNNIIIADGQGNRRININANGDVGIGATAPATMLQVGQTGNTGNITVVGTGTTCTIGNGTGATNCTSDMRLKENIVDLSANTLEKLLALRPVTFNWNTIAGRNGSLTHMGLIAQEVQKHFSDSVNTVYNDQTLGDVYGIDYASLVVPAIKAIQEQQILLNGKDGQLLDGLVTSAQTIETIKTESPKNAIDTITTRLSNGTKVLTDFVSARTTAIRGYFDKIFAGEVTTEILCVGKEGNKTCIDKAQLESLISSHQNSISVFPSISRQISPVLPVVSRTVDPQIVGVNPTSVVISTPTPDPASIISAPVVSAAVAPPLNPQMINVDPNPIPLLQAVVTPTAVIDPITPPITPTIADPAITTTP